MEILGLLVFVIFIAVIWSIIMAYPFMLMWNYVVVEAVTICNPVEFWEAFWLMLFISLFIKNSTTTSKKE